MVSLQQELKLTSLLISTTTIIVHKRREQELFQETVQELLLETVALVQGYHAGRQDGFQKRLVCTWHCWQILHKGCNERGGQGAGAIGSIKSFVQYVQKARRKAKRKEDEITCEATLCHADSDLSVCPRSASVLEEAIGSAPVQVHYGCT